MNPLPTATLVTDAHQLYCQLTGQSLTLRFDRERHWFEWLRAGFTLDDLRQVIAYLQREIRQERRNVGALKLSNLLQPDRFEEDLHIARVRLRPPLPPPQPPSPPPPPPRPPDQEAAHRRRCQELLRHARERLRLPHPTSTNHPATHEPSSTHQSVTTSTD